jgi:hypothetical protein
MLQHYTAPPLTPTLYHPMGEGEPLTPTLSPSEGEREKHRRTGM